jgi:hypothetical protein
MENSAMLRFVVLTLGFLTFALPVRALDFPARTPGLWELEFTPDLAGHDLPPQRPLTARQCIDATVDQLLWRRDFGGEPDDLKICRSNISSSNSAITADFVCSFAEMSSTMTMHMVISGDFNSAYTMEITSTFRGVAPGGFHLTIAYKYIGPCEADQRPGDFITGDGQKGNILGDRKPLDKR